MADRAQPAQQALRRGRRPRHGSGLKLRHAAALGALQGPAELLPVSSSGHLALVPALLGWPPSGLDDEEQKAFDVALHTGTAAALLIVLRAEVAEVLRHLDRERVLRHGLELLPPALAVLLFERPIERRLGTPRGVAGAQIVAGTALALADLSPAERGHADARPSDALLVGLAQASALVPGVSRNGATLTTARLLRFRRRAANRISRHAALPVIVAAAGLKGARLWRRGLPRAIPVGAAAAFASTLAASPLVRVVDGAPSYAPFAAYRVALGVVSLMRLNGVGGR